MKADRQMLVRLLLGFWAAWFALVTASNLADGFKAAGLLSENWWWVSGNFELIEQAIARFRLPRPVVGSMFVVVIGWELMATILYARAACCAARVDGENTAIDRAAIVGVGLFAGFVLFDELLLIYETGSEAVHLRILIAQLVTWLVARIGNP
jgi:hypothetical protein